MTTGGTMEKLVLDRDPVAPPPGARPAGPPRALPGRPLRPALLAGEDVDAPDRHIFRGTD
ncbi:MULTISPECIES: hypothetical protein [Streptomyces]